MNKETEVEMTHLTQHKKMFGNLVRKARRNANLTQKELAGLIGTHQPDVARAETTGCGLVFAVKAIQGCGYDLKFHHVSLVKGDTQLTSFYG